MSTTRIPLLCKQVLTATFVALISSNCVAEMWKCVDQDGNTRYTNVKADAKGCKTLFLGSPRGNIPALLKDGDAAYERRDYATAIRLYRTLADKGNALGQFRLGSMYESSGAGVPHDDAEAVRWYRLAAIQGFDNAQYNLGWMYQMGKGVAQDFVRARMWYNLALLSSTVEMRSSIKANIEYAEERMTPAQIAMSEKMANICRASNYKQCGELEGTQTATISSFAPTPSPAKSGSTRSSAVAIPLQKEGGTFVVPVLINNAITLNFVVDSGAADVSIPADVVSTLIRTGTLQQSDFIGERIYVLADGSKVPSMTFRIRSMRVGDRVVENVTGSVAPLEGSLLLGQSFLGRFKSWSIDNNKKALLLE